MSCPWWWSSTAAKVRSLQEEIKVLLDQLGMEKESKMKYATDLEHEAEQHRKQAMESYAKKDVSRALLQTREYQNKQRIREHCFRRAVQITDLEAQLREFYLTKTTNENIKRIAGMLKRMHRHEDPEEALAELDEDVAEYEEFRMMAEELLGSTESSTFALTDPNIFEEDLMDKLKEWTGVQPQRMIDSPQRMIDPQAAPQRMIEPQAVHDRPASASQSVFEPQAVHDRPSAAAQSGFEPMEGRRPPSPPVAPPERADRPVTSHSENYLESRSEEESDLESVLTEEQEERLRNLAYGLPMAPREEQEEADKSLAEMMSG
jgi:hypothetical protein